MRFMGGLAIGLVAGYCLVLFGWVAYTNIVRVSNFEGAAAMQVAFFFAPLGGLLTGLVLGILWQTRRRDAPPRDRA
jgi:hypothetical protein